MPDVRHPITDTRLPTSDYRLNNPLQLADAFGEGGGAGLQDVRRLDLVDSIGADRRDGVPPFALEDCPLLHRLTAPRGHDALRIALDDLRRIDHAVLPERFLAQLGEDRFTAGNFDQLLDPSDSRDQRVVPFFEEHAWAPWPHTRLVANFPQPGFETVRKRVARVRAADQRADDADHLQNLGDAALVECVDGISAADQLACDVRLKIGERENEIRPERVDLVEPRVEERRHFRLLPCFRRTHGVPGDAHDTIAFTEQIQNFGCLFGKTDDSVRIRVNSQFPTPSPNVQRATVASLY